MRILYRRPARPKAVELSLASRLRLNSGWEMPRLGLGVWQVGGPETVAAVTAALGLGYRLIDTAKLYGNEAEVGRAVRDSGVDRQQVFVTTKLWNDDHGARRAPAAFEASLRRLGLEYVDLYLIHWPGSGERLETWRALAAIAKDGRAHSIGVSNFTVAHLEELIRETGVVPAVNQVEQHPRLYQRALDEYCAAHGIAIECYSPLARGRAFRDRTILEVAKAHERTPAQVMLRWGLEHGFVVIPKSVRPERIAENARVFDFALSPAEMAQLDALGSADRTAWDPTHVP